MIFHLIFFSRGTTAIYSPRANPTERRNQEIKKGLPLHLMVEQHNGISNYLQFSTICDVGRTGVTPAHLLLGKALNRPVDWKLQLQATAIEERLFRVTQAQLQQAKYQAKYASVAPKKVPIKPGDLVYTKTHPLFNVAERYYAGFEVKWEGLFAVTNQLSEDIFELSKHGSSTKTHRSELRPNSSYMKLATPTPPSSDLTPTRVHSDQIPTTPSSDPIPTSTPLDPTPITSDSNQAPTTPSLDVHPTTTPEKEGREKEDDGSEERQPRYNLRRRK
uniref:Reverse transcriptase RNase H-like domain-containing protein n=1 Tax=Trichogramma kaykai TaxID=54128 RepID=A0ABD2WL25_9HYME